MIKTFQLLPLEFKAIQWTGDEENDWPLIESALNRTVYKDLSGRLTFKWSDPDRGFLNLQDWVCIYPNGEVLLRSDKVMQMCAEEIVSENDNA